MRDTNILVSLFARPNCEKGGRKGETYGILEFNKRMYVDVVKTNNSKIGRNLKLVLPTT